VIVGDCGDSRNAAGNGRSFQTALNTVPNNRAADVAADLRSVPSFYGVRSNEKRPAEGEALDSVSQNAEAS
jgi:hypothetical protein